MNKKAYQLPEDAYKLHQEVLQKIENEGVLEGFKLKKNTILKSMIILKSLKRKG